MSVSFYAYLNLCPSVIFPLINKGFITGIKRINSITIWRTVTFTLKSDILKIFIRRNERWK